MPTQIMIKKFVAPLVLIPSICLSLSGCGTFKQLKKEVKILDGDYRLTGKIENPSGDLANVYVGVWKNNPSGDGSVTIVEVTSPNSDGLFAMFLKPGPEYYFLALEDADGSGRWDEGEPLWYYGKPDALPLEQGRGYHVDVTLSTLMPSENLPFEEFRKARGGREVHELTSGGLVPVVLGDIADFDSPEFSDPEMERQGLWEPASFLKQRGFGIYFMEDYDPAKRPVLFVNGCGGSPRTWKYIISNLDRRKYQPWIWNAPSGLRLEESARGLNGLVKMLHERHGFDRLDVVAYSMGGLTTRRFLQMNLNEDGHRYIEKFVSISTPWGGHEMAEMGIEKAPTAIPAWHDIRTESPFIQKLYQVEPPVDHYMIYTTKGKKSPFLPKNNDGTVSIVSQTDERATSDAREIDTYHLTHTSVMESPQVVDTIEGYLEDTLLQKIPNPLNPLREVLNRD